MSSQNNKSREPSQKSKQNWPNASQLPSPQALSKASHLALLGSQSDLDTDPKTNKNQIFVNKSELASFKANSPEVKMDDHFFQNRLKKKFLPSLFSLDKKLEGKIDFFRDRFTEKKEKNRNPPTDKIIGETKHTVNIKSNFEHFLKSEKINILKNKTSLIDREMEFTFQGKEGRSSLLGKRKISQDIQNMRALPLKSSLKKIPRNLQEREKVKILTRKILKSYKFNNKMANNAFKKVCQINIQDRGSDSSKTHSNRPKSFVLQINESESEGEGEREEGGRETQTMQDLFAKRDKMVVPPNSGLRKDRDSKKCRETRLWTQVLDKIKLDAKKKKRRKRKSLRNEESFSFHKMEKTVIKKKNTVDMNGVFEFLDLSFKNINKDTSNN